MLVGREGMKKDLEIKSVIGCMEWVGLFGVKFAKKRKLKRIL
jgi:hypothetical protein